jgi:DNA invertase Pin-like site-specific DNA recombinase
MEFFMTQHAWLYNRFSPRPQTNDERLALARGESAENAEDTASMKTQLEANTRYCEYHKIVIDNVLREPFTSAHSTSLFDRPEGSKLQSLPREMIVVAMDMTRIFRDTVDGLLTIRQFNKQGIQLRLSDQGGNSINVDTPDGFAFVTMKLMMAEYEPMCTALRTSRGMKFRQKQGQRMTRPGHEPFGVLNGESDIVERIMARYRAGDAYSYIADVLNHVGIPHRTTRWKAAKVRAIVERKLEA